jgi:DNA invertase Pin-like site-specific DNA recombinase
VLQGNIAEPPDLLGDRGSSPAVGPWRALKAALKLCKGRKSTLVIAALDRLARNVVFVATLVETRVDFVALDLPDATPFMIHIYAAVAEEESREKGQLLSAAIAISRARGTQWATAALVRSAKVRRWSESLRPVVGEIRSSGIKGTTLLARELNRRGLQSEPGAPWNSHSARTLLVHLGLYERGGEPWPEFRARRARERLDLVSALAHEHWKLGTEWPARVAGVLNGRNVRTATGELWDAKRVKDTVRYAARRHGGWCPPELIG